MRERPVLLTEEDFRGKILRGAHDIPPPPPAPPPPTHPPANHQPAVHDPCPPAPASMLLVSPSHARLHDHRLVLGGRLHAPRLFLGGLPPCSPSRPPTPASMLLVSSPLASFASAPRLFLFAAISYASWSLPDRLFLHRIPRPPLPLASFQLSAGGRAERPGRRVERQGQLILLHVVGGKAGAGKQGSRRVGAVRGMRGKRRWREVGR